MDYINAEAAARKWGVSTRRVQRLCAQGRIPQVVRLGRSWMIPRDTKKPENLRLQRKSQEELQAKKLSSQDKSSEDNLEVRQPEAIDWSVVDATSVFPDVTSQVDETSIYSLMNRLYLQGSFDLVLEFYHNNQPDAISTIALSYYAVAASISCGDIDTYEEITTNLELLEAEYRGCHATEKAIKLCLAVAPVSAFAASLAPEWIKEGSFNHLPAAFSSAAVAIRIKYLLATGQFEKALSAAETAITYETFNQTISIHGINFRLACAAANYWLGLSDKALRWMEEAIDICLSNGVTTPLSDNLANFGGLMEEHVKKQFPEYLEVLIAQSQQATKNWTLFYNRISKTSLTSLLTVKELSIARRAATKIPYAEIAKDAGVSIGSIKNTMQSIYGKLHIKSRDELRHLVVPENMER